VQDERRDPGALRPDPGGVSATVLERYPEHAKHIACIIAAWTNIEYKLVLTLSQALQSDVNVVTPMLYAIQSSRGRLSAIDAAFAAIDMDESRRATIQSVIKDADSVLRARDKFAHALYGWAAAGDSQRGPMIRGLGRRPTVLLAVG
jgi:hypothetical protein